MKRTTIALDEVLVTEGKRATGIKTTKGLVHYALQELVRREKQLDPLSLKGKVRWEGNLDEMRRGQNA